MTRVGIVVLTAEIMQKGKVLYDQRIRPCQARQLQAIKSNPRPVRCAMDTIPIQFECLLGEVDQRWCDVALIQQSYFR